ncbi:unnamed protein product [Aureobasidium mustum]|uniref:Uncharacterized protein n=1 Tax=Aureobasidium mustum TaxID=2773714 RepID=A0A9N8JVR6_9PEZI|nr:unnamed protein product [Aureobasidium mustum]
MHAILEEALNMWGDFLAGRLDTAMDQDALHDYLSLSVRDHIEALYKNNSEKRGYMKYWMTRAFDAFWRFPTGQDTDMWAWMALNTGSVMMPSYNFLLPERSELASDGEDEGDEDMEDEVDKEVGEGDKEMEEDAEGEEEDAEGEEDDTIGYQGR